MTLGDYKPELDDIGLYRQLANTEKELNKVRGGYKDMLWALEHAAQSMHSPDCYGYHDGSCTCHVGKAKAAIAKAKEVTG